MSTPNPLAAEIERAALALGISPSTVGERAGQGGKFYSRLLEGCRTWPQTDAKVRQALASMTGAAEAAE